MIIALFNPKGQILGFRNISWGRKIKLPLGATKKFLRERVNSWGRDEHEYDEVIEKTEFESFREKCAAKGEELLLESSGISPYILLMTGTDAGEFTRFLHEKYGLL